MRTLVSSREAECAVANSAWREAHVHCAIGAIPPARAPALVVTSNLELAEPRDERRAPWRDRHFSHFKDIAFGATDTPRSADAAGLRTDFDFARMHTSERKALERTDSFQTEAGVGG
jgi:hypothetical protein